MNIDERASRIECILCDVDGTLTDGGIRVHGKERGRTFNIRDGLGIHVWKRAGFRFGFITGDDSHDTKERAEMLKADFKYFNCLDKRAAINEILNKSDLEAEQIAFIGDDLIDIPVLRKVGLAVAVADAVPELEEVIHYRTDARGGSGAVRELIERILKAKGMWKDIVKLFHADRFSDNSG